MLRKGLGNADRGRGQLQILVGPRPGINWRLSGADGDPAYCFFEVNGESYIERKIEMRHSTFYGKIGLRVLGVL
jgi:hypothetical protein